MIPPSQARISRDNRILNAVNLLKEGGISPFDMILDILDKFNPEYWSYRNKIYKEKSMKLFSILEKITGSTAGKQKLWVWMRPHALQLVQDIVDEEMDAVNKENKISGISAITPEYIESWSVSSSRAQAPVLTDILFNAAQTARAKDHNKRKRLDAVSP